MSSSLVILACARKHGLTDEDIEHAWRNVAAARWRNIDAPCHIAVAGVDARGRLVELLAAEREDGKFVVYHAMKLTGKMAHELDLGKEG